MSDKPLVSITIPVYNREKYIRSCLDSILDEDYPNKEIVLINDGSTDNTDSIIRQWIKEHEHEIPVKYKVTENRGIPAALNDLIETSEGEYIVFFGSDDYLKNNGISKRYEYLKNNPEKLVVIGDCIVIDEKDNFVHESAMIKFGNVDKKSLLSDESLKKYMILEGYVPGATLMANKKIYEIIGKYDPSLLFEDWVFYVKVVSKDLLGYLDEIVSAYRVHSQNMCFSEIQTTVTYQQIQVSFECMKDFPELKHKYYFVRRIIYLYIWLFYLKLKFYLFRENKQLHDLLFKIKNFIKPFIVATLQRMS